MLILPPLAKVRTAGIFTFKLNNINIKNSYSIYIHTSTQTSTPTPKPNTIPPKSPLKKPPKPQKPLQPPNKTTLSPTHFQLSIFSPFQNHTFPLSHTPF
nr:MAG TPA: hypothetical protein [Caudoviricetes sp.]